jgi:hypothetical protein
MMTCRICGKTQDEHHMFEPDYKVPSGCKCNPREWVRPDKIPEICKNYTEDNGLCKNCEHLPECHSTP